MTSLGRLRCVAPGCAGEALAEPDGTLRCPACGDRRAAREYFRPYGQRTAQWIIGGSVLFSAGWGRSGALRMTLLSLGGLFLLYAAYRVAVQALGLYRARQRKP